LTLPNYIRHEVWQQPRGDRKERRRFLKSASAGIVTAAAAVPAGLSKVHPDPLEAAERQSRGTPHDAAGTIRHQRGQDVERRLEDRGPTSGAIVKPNGS
jgi:hypothetical protein